MAFRRGNLGFFTLQGLFWATYCTLFAFTVSILRQYGYSAELCGLVTTLQCILLMVIQPVYGYLADRFTTPKRGFIAVMLLGVLFAVPLFWIFELNRWVVVLYMSLLGLFIYSAGPLVDVWCVSVINRTRGMDYALCRGGGSVFYATVALLAGNLIAPFGVQVLYLLHIVLGLCTVGVALLLVDSRKIESEKPVPQPVAQSPSFFASARVLLRSRDYVVFTGCMCLYNFGTRPYSTYLALVLENAGGSDAHYGASLFISAMGEIVFMLLASRLLFRGAAPCYLYLVAVSILALRFFVMGITDNLWVLVATQLVQAVGFGLNLRINAEYLMHTAPPGYEGMAITLSSSIAVGIGCVLGNYLGGLMIGWWGVQVYVLICAGTLALIVPAFLPTVLREHRTRRALRLQQLLDNNIRPEEKQTL